MYVVCIEIGYKRDMTLRFKTMSDLSDFMETFLNHCENTKDFEIRIMKASDMELDIDDTQLENKEESEEK